MSEYDEDLLLKMFGKRTFKESGKLDATLGRTTKKMVKSEPQSSNRMRVTIKVEPFQIFFKEDTTVIPRDAKKNLKRKFE